MPGAVRCTKCWQLIPATSLRRAQSFYCPSCGTGLTIYAFPALIRNQVSFETARAASDGQAVCFFHPENMASTVCDACGRFVCSVCDMEFLGRHLCPGCLESGRTSGGYQNLDTRRMLYDSISLKVAIYPVLIFFFAFLSIFTAPISIYMAIRTWNRPGSIVRNSKIKYILAILISALEIISWAGFIFMMVTMEGK
jgi:hypothetical protein